MKLFSIMVNRENYSRGSQVNLLKDLRVPLDLCLCYSIPPKVPEGAEN